MSEITKVALDAMGGDNAPAAAVKGAVDAVLKEPGVHVFLVGQEEIIHTELEKYNYDKERIEIVNATEVIEMAEYERPETLSVGEYLPPPCKP